MGRRAAKIAGRKGKSDAIKTKVFATYGKKLVMVRPRRVPCLIVYVCMHITTRRHC